MNGFQNHSFLSIVVLKNIRFSELFIPKAGFAYAWQNDSVPWNSKNGSENRSFLCMVLLENVRFWRTVLSNVRFSIIKVKVFAETGVQQTDMEMMTQAQEELCMKERSTIAETEHDWQSLATILCTILSNNNNTFQQVASDADQDLHILADDMEIRVLSRWFIHIAWSELNNEELSISS